ncbi:cyclin-dependent kinase inhibitor 1Ca [Esox lucius]|uniref:Cyclin-dependent kinase inhibitor domain-containing protein n=1 Tax=Esox lucius TaxID=8010 RepID=A0A3P9AHL5_ESOLU|nr:cyclin-dependent kinase inhibitor 1Ca [Esox lucius]
MTNFEKSCGTNIPAARMTYLHRRTSVCRKLFGPVDHDELSRELKAKLREISERDQRRWNFNFEGDTPMPGIYEWEGMSKDSTPAFYQESTKVGGMKVVTLDLNPDFTSEVVPEHLRGCCHNKTPTSVWEHTVIPPNEVNQENCSNSQNTRKCNTKATSCVRRTRSKTTYSERDVNVSQITDYFPKRRRSTSEIKISQHNSSLSIPLEQTPRKAKIIR